MERERERALTRPVGPDEGAGVQEVRDVVRHSNVAEDGEEVVEDADGLGTHPQLRGLTDKHPEEGERGLRVK